MEDRHDGAGNVVAPPPSLPGDEDDTDSGSDLEEIAAAINARHRGAPGSRRLQQGTDDSGVVSDANLYSFSIFVSSRLIH